MRLAALLALILVAAPASAQTAADSAGILDIFQNTASVRVDARGWVDYMHMVRWGGRWAILNVVWEMRKSS